MSGGESLPRVVLEPIVRRALLEDLGRGGDVTTAAVVPPDARCSARIISRASGRVAGLAAARLAFSLLDDEAGVSCLEEGAAVESGTVIAEIEGRAAPILTGERTALNFIGHLSGVAGMTARFVAEISGTGAKICCTRKTTPGLRVLEKHAVRTGGGVNHRFGLDDGFLIKDNHIIAAGGLAAAIRRARDHCGHMMRLEAEVDTLAQLEEALAEGVDAVLLDNMDVKTLKQAVSQARGRALLEASGGITPETARAVAESGVDLISSGSLTHSSGSLDVSLEVSLL